jgi:hypothetical protein
MSRREPRETVAAVEHALGTTILRVAGVFCLAMAVVALVAPREPDTSYSRIVVIIATILIVGLAVAVVRVRPRYALLRAAPARFVPHAVTVVGTVVCTAFAIGGRYEFGWDARLVARMADNVVTGAGLTNYEYGYLSRYPNNLALLSVNHLTSWIGDQLGLPAALVFIVLNGLCLAATVQATYWVVAMLRGRGAGIAAQLVVLLFIGLSPWMTVSYTDLIGAPFPILATALVIAAARAPARTRQVLLLIGAVVSAVIGYEIKTTPVVTVAALVIAALFVLAAPGKASRRTVAVGLVAALLLFLGGAFVTERALPSLAGVTASRIDYSRSPPLVWWYYMGTTQHRSDDGKQRYGGYDIGLVNATLRMSGQASGRYARHLLRKRLEALGPLGYLHFLANKAAWNWGDGMFWAWGEGDDTTAPVLAADPLTGFVHAWNHPKGSSYGGRADLTEAAWLALLLLLGARLLFARWRWDVGALVLSVLGIAAFTLVFQGRSRYLLVYVPVVAALALALPGPQLRGRRDALQRFLGREDDGGADGEVTPGEPALVESAQSE